MKQNYIPISRKYRPQLFRDVVGQEPIVTTLKNALRLGKVAHAYLFCGTRGTGKTTLARIFAKALNCKNLNQDSEPCNECSSCQEIVSGHSLDVIEIDGASNRGIDDIRSINETVGYSPSSGEYKIYIIDEVHMLTKEAFNALLKTLEEPPEKVKFFFATTEPHKLPPTILSRLQRFDLLRISDTLIVKKLHEIARDLNRSVESEAIQRVASFAEGSLRDAESLFDQVLCYEEARITEEIVQTALGLIPKSYFLELDKAFTQETLNFAFALTEKIYLSGTDFGCFLEQLSLHFRSHLAAKMANPKMASPYTEEQCLHIIDLLLDGMQKMHRSPFKRVDVEMLLLNILRSKKRVPLEMVVKRLIELEKAARTNTPLEKAEPAQEQVLPPKEVESDIPPAIKEETAVKEEVPALPSPKEIVPEEPIVLKPVPFTLSPAKKVDIAAAISSLQPPAKKVDVATATALQPKAIIETPSEKGSAPKISEASIPLKKGAHYDTLLRFAAVELEGTLKKGDIHG